MKAKTMKTNQWWTELGPDQHHLVLQAALTTPPFSLDHLTSVSSLGPVNILQLMERLVQAGVLREDSSQGRGFFYFAEPATLEFIFNSFSRSELQAGARRMIRHLEGALSDGLKKHFALAYLYHVSGLPADHPVEILGCADHSLALHLKDEAALYYRLVLSGLSGRLRSRTHKQVFIRAVLGFIATQGHMVPLAEQEKFLQRARARAKSLDDPSLTAEVNLVYGHVCQSEGKYRLAQSLLDEAWEIARGQGDEELRRKVSLKTTDFLFWRGRVQDAVARYEEVIGNLEKIPDDENMLRACATLGWCYGICGRTARGLGLIEAVRLRAKELHLADVKTHTDLMTVLTLLDARRVPEAEVYLSDILSNPPQELGHYVMWAAQAAMAYVLFHHGDLAGASRLQHSFHEHSRKWGRTHHRGPWNFDYLAKLEDAGMIHPEMNYETELNRMLDWPDIYMKGVARRARAERRLNRGAAKSQVLADLSQSMALLRRAGARLELARSQVLMGRLLLSEGKTSRARGVLAEAWETFRAVNESLFPEDLRAHVDPEDREELLVKTFSLVGDTLGTVRQRKVLLEKIINLTMGLTHAEWGGFFEIDDQGRLTLVASRNLDPAMVGTERFAANREIIERVCATGKGMTRDARPAKDETRRHTIGTGWLICSPVTLKDRLIGALYFEGLLSRPSFPEKGLSLLTAIGHQAAVALDNVRAYEEIAALKDRLAEETRHYRMESDTSPHVGHLVGRSDSMVWVKRQMDKVAATDTTVLITGQTGVGKELVARGIHRLSPRAEGPFIAVNTASLAEGLIASELFGHERGAFTGALQARPGRFELAHGGTLFLDDVQYLPLDAQVKLLRALQEKEFERVGGRRTIKSDFRLIAATNQALEDLVDQGRFRSDLYYRLKVFPILVPSLNQRREDIPDLVAHFLAVYSRKFGKDLRGVSHKSMERLMDYPWPGNVRELRHVIERAVILSEGEVLKVPPLSESAPAEGHRRSWPSLDEMQRTYITDCLEECGWRVSGPQGAAHMLGLKPTTLHSKMKRLGIHRKSKPDQASSPSGPAPGPGPD
jgi:transcriptional regulator with GAF, ATPase, and Fis domain/tetratricopeptide (TPR) repeat protein